MRRAAIFLTALLGSVVVALGLDTSVAWAQDEGVQGTLTYDNEPVADAVINVFTPDGEQVGSAESDASGEWFVSVAESADYRVELDESTLPDGLVSTSGNVRELFVREDSVSNVLFPLGTSRQSEPDENPSPGDTSPGQEPGEGGEDPAQAAQDPDEPMEEDPEEIAGPGRFEREVTAIYSGLHFGLVIALAALGLSLIFGTMGLVNFAHGELVSFGALIAATLNVIGVFGLKLHLLVAAPIAVAIGVLFGYLLDRHFWSRLRRRGTGLIVMMIVSIGLALLLRNGYQYFYGGGRRQYEQFAVQEPINLGPLFVQPKTLVTDGIALVVLLAVTLALVLTRLGKAVRAVADNPALAAASGINVDRVIRLVWAIGGGLAALSGVILALHQSATFQMGFQMLLLVFAAVIAGGLGTAFGAVVGAIIVGLLIQVSTLWIPNEFKYVAALLLLILVMLVRPQGIMGRRERVG